MDPITQTAANSLGSLAEYGLAGIFLMLLLIGGIIIIRYFMAEFKACKEENKEFAKDMVEKNVAVIEKNTEAFHGVRIALAEMAARHGQ